uniref:Uncharacterized protein n=1 Tax=Tanacetum cinerariifolium TaxID=118510 RepID=A0A6L2NKW2_TANCI|nr:hypothetical protein [Tanacetum cinerariifolium]
MWCQELMVHLAPPATPEESNALNNATALERAWFSLARGASSQTDILERFEHLQADFEKVTDTHAEYGEMVGRLIQDRLDLAHSSHLYITLSDRYKTVKNRALRIKELKGELANKDSALIYVERISAERAQEKEKLVTQLSRTEMENFDCICKLLPTMVERLFQSQTYKQSLYEPLNLAIQAGWGKGLTEECYEEDLIELMSRMENFDAYVDKKMYVEYDKLFEKRYLYVKKISYGFYYAVSDLLKVYPDSSPSDRTLPANPLAKFPQPLLLTSHSLFVSHGWCSFIYLNSINVLSI